MPMNLSNRVGSGCVSATFHCRMTSSTDVMASNHGESAAGGGGDGVACVTCVALVRVLCLTTCHRLCEIEEQIYTLACCSCDAPVHNILINVDAKVLTN